MKRAILSCLAILWLAAMPCLAQKKRYAPLREQILSARSIYLTGQPESILDKCYRELQNWGRFQMVPVPQEADLILEIVYNRSSAGDLGVTDTQTLTLRNGKTREVLYSDSREHSTGGGAVGFFTGLHSMSLSMLKDLRKRIEATESERTFEYAIQLATRTAKYFADLSAFNEKLANVASPADADSFKDKARTWKSLADDLSKTTSEMTRYFANASPDDLLRKRNVDQIEKWRDDSLFRGCGTFAAQENINRSWGQVRDKLPLDVVQALDALESDGEVLNEDCTSELAKNLLKRR